jgi:hypothetical protein
VLSNLALDTLIEVGLLNAQGAICDISSLPDHEVSKRISSYIQSRAVQFPLELKNVSISGRLSGLYSSTSVDLTNSKILASALIYESQIINDPLMVRYNIRYKDLIEGLNLFAYFFKLIRADIVKIYPLLDLVQPNENEIPFLVSDDAFKSSIPEKIHDYIHKNAVQKSVIPNENGGMYVLSEFADVNRRMALNVSFKNDYWQNGTSLYLFQTSVTESYSDNSEILKLKTKWNPKGTLSKEKFDFWSYQTINQAMRSRLIGISTESSISQKLGHTYITESPFEAKLLNMTTERNPNQGEEAKGFFDANGTLLNIDSPETILALRTKDPQLYQRFNETLLDLSGELAGYKGEEFNRRARRLFSSEIEPQIKEVRNSLNAMKSGFTKGSLVSLGGLSASIVSGGSAIPFLAMLGLGVASGFTESLSGVSQYQKLKKTPAFIWHRMKKT